MGGKEKKIVDFKIQIKRTPVIIERIVEGS
jgi:hypothetical protein